MGSFQLLLQGVQLGIQCGYVHASGFPLCRQLLGEALDHVEALAGVGIYLRFVSILVQCASISVLVSIILSLLPLR
jgi:hypothetical protein